MRDDAKSTDMVWILHVRQRYFDAQAPVSYLESAEMSPGVEKKNGIEKGTDLQVNKVLHVDKQNGT